MFGRNAAIFIVPHRFLWYCYCVCSGRGLEFDSPWAFSFQVLCCRSLDCIGGLHL